MTQQYGDSTERDVTESGAGSEGSQARPPAGDVSHHQHDLAQPPGKFAEGADQGTSGEGAVTARPDADQGDQVVPAAIAKPSDPPSHEKGPTEAGADHETSRGAA
ncbi:hypothetical protein [Catellatospora methionotrophica]|uniref:hypothetical protein n=1 Tax=Catellatospora methionotrophica TaxID=121620 RepID=UPI0033E7C20A